MRPWRSFNRNLETEQANDVVARARALVAFARSLGLQSHIEFNPCLRDENALPVPADLAREYDPGRTVDLQIYIALTNI